MPRFSDAPRQKSGPGSAISSSISRRVHRKTNFGIVGDVEENIEAKNDRCGVIGKQGLIDADDIIDDDDELGFLSQPTAVDWQKEKKIEVVDKKTKVDSKFPKITKKKTTDTSVGPGKTPNAATKEIPSEVKKANGSRVPQVTFHKDVKLSPKYPQTPVTPSDSLPYTPENDALGTLRHSNNTLPCLSRAVVVDTRVLQTFAGDAAGNAFLIQSLNFLKSLARRGALPRTLATIHAKLNTDSGGVGIKPQNIRGGRQPRAVIEARAAHLPPDVLSGRDHRRDSGRGGGEKLRDSLEPSSREERVWESLLEPVHIRPPVNASNINNRSAVHVPKSLLAHDSWRMFGDLIDTVIKENERRQGNVQTIDNQVDPLQVTILTNDISLFSDTNVDSHKRGLARFWDRCRSGFQSNCIRSISVMVVETGVAALETGRSATPDDPNVTNIAAASDCSTNDGPTLNSPSSASSHKLKIAECIKALRDRIAILSDTDYKKNASSSSYISLDVSVEVMDCNSIAFDLLMRSWIRISMNPPSGRGRLHFDLPETLDGTQCSIDLDLSYTVLPYRVDSCATAGLLADMSILTSSYVEVVQLIPLSKVDASLLYGIPMTAKAGMENDLSQYKEMQLLVRQLWKYLAMNELALVLKCGNSSSSDSCGIRYFEYHMSGSYFLLVVEEVPNQENKPSDLSASVAKRGSAPANAIMYRYAMNDELLRDANEDCNVEDSIAEGDVSIEETNRQYFEYIEQSLDYLECCAMNPVLHGNGFSCTEEPVAQASQECDEENDATQTTEKEVLEQDALTRDADIAPNEQNIEKFTTVDTSEDEDPFGTCRFDYSPTFD